MVSEMRQCWLAASSLASPRLTLQYLHEVILQSQLLLNGDRSAAQQGGATAGALAADQCWAAGHGLALHDWGGLTGGGERVVNGSADKACACESRSAELTRCISQQRHARLLLLLLLLLQRLYRKCQ